MTEDTRTRLTLPRWPAWTALLLVAGLVTGCGGTRRSDADFAALYRAGTTGAMASAGGSQNAVGSTDGGVAPAASGSAPQPASGAAAGTTDGAVAGAPAGVVGSAGSARGAAAAPVASHGPGAASATGAPIRLATVGLMSGPVGGAVGYGAGAVQAWAAAVNAAGGINGHPVQLFVADDGGDPAKHVALVRQMVEQNHVVAFVHNPAPLEGQAAVPYLEQHHIPVVGSEGGSPWVNTSPMFFPQMPSDSFESTTFAGEMATIGRPMGLTKIAIVYCAEAPGCQSATNPEAFRKAGLDPVYTAKVSLGSPDYTAQCLSARNAGAQMFFMGVDGQAVQRMADNCETIGYKPLYGQVSQGVVTAELGKSNLDGVVVGAPTVPWFQTSIPAVAEFTQALARFAPALESNGSSMQGWISAKLMEAALRAAPDPTTSSGVLQGLWSIKANDLGGLSYPISFREGAPNNSWAEQGCWWLVRAQGGKFTSPDAGQRHCA